VIVTLAGHVDHGKTSLVQALTGVNTDRLAEEKRRGLTIDLGFAYLTDNDTTLGFVDVPGHHRFIHNMVAGISSQQHALLVIAADDGPMPQSREHLQILELIGVTDGVIALTKCDRVDAEREQQAEAEIRALTAGSFLEAAPIFHTSATTGAGVDELLAHLGAANERYQVSVEARNFRLAVDRAFNVRGSGLVVTGTVHAGTVEVEDELVVFPGAGKVRVRGIHAQNQEASRASVGDRCAINLVGLSLDDVSRGSWLSGESAQSGGSTGGHTQLAIELTVLKDYPREVRHWTPVHVYHATSHATGRLALLDRDVVRPGESGLAEIVLDEPLLGKRGDRVVLRDQGLDLTLGGGSVVYNRWTTERRRDPNRLRELKAYAEPDPQASFARLLELGPLDLDAFRACWDPLPADLDEMVRNADGQLHDGYLIADALWAQWLASTFAEVQARHTADSTLQGLKANELSTGVPERFRGDVLTVLAVDGKLTQRSGHFLPAAHEAELSPAEASLFEQLTAHLDQQQPPSLGDLAKLLRIPIPKLQRDLQPLVGKRRLVQISSNRYYLPKQITPLVEVADQLSESATLTVRQFRDAAGIGRNVAIEVLEYFDSRGYTKRNGDTRQVVGDRGRLLGT
jgi:selenocysteine-specific elongation factor